MERSLLKSSIGKKLIVALSGLFLMSFLVVHLLVNLMLIIDDTGVLFNKAAHFMATNPAIRIVEPLLALGFGVHIVYTLILTIQNMRSRPVRYAKSGSADEVSWASRNMFILGGLIATFLVMHLFHFFIKMKFTGDPLFTDVVIDGENMKNGYLLVSTLFKTSLFYSIIYVIGAIFLGLHLVHGFWSAFQSIGFANKNWLPRLKTVALIFAVIMATGFSIIPLYFIFLF
jgi:succinate dehydrogenase / fumarate reductase cytochrome b subunit